jgi:hypothetical protein
MFWRLRKRRRVGEEASAVELEAATREASEALPAGWKLLDFADREIYTVPGAKIVTYSVAAHGPNGEVEMVIAVGEANAYRQLARRLRGELEMAEGWAPPLG